jgi:hypothetical protein
MTPADKLQPWPSPQEFNTMPAFIYFRKRSLAAEQRLRMAVEALEKAYGALGSYNDQRCEECQDLVHEALAAIGTLPPEGT